MKRLAQLLGMTEGQTYTVVLGVVLGLATAVVGIPPALQDRVAPPVAAASPASGSQAPSSEVAASPPAPAVRAPDADRPLRVGDPAPAPAREAGGTVDRPADREADRPDFSNGSFGAGSPVRQGWWSQVNPPLPGLPLPEDVPSSPTAPDVPADGLYVSGGREEPSAYSALVYLVPEGGTEAVLTLRVHPDSLSTPGAALRACLIPEDEADFVPEQGGSIESAPRFDCEDGVEGEPTDAGAAYRFDVGDLVRDGKLAVAVVPGDASGRVVFSRPDERSLSER